MWTVRRSNSRQQAVARFRTVSRNCVLVVYCWNKYLDFRSGEHHGFGTWHTFHDMMASKWSCSAKFWNKCKDEGHAWWGFPILKGLYTVWLVFATYRSRLAKVVWKDGGAMRDRKWFGKEVCRRKWLRQPLILAWCMLHAASWCIISRWWWSPWYDSSRKFDCGIIIPWFCGWFKHVAQGRRLTVREEKIIMIVVALLYTVKCGNWMLSWVRIVSVLILQYLEANWRPCYLDRLFWESDP